MANSKISALPAASTPLAGTELVPVVQGGITEQVSVANLTAGRAVSAASLTLSTGDLTFSTAGKQVLNSSGRPALNQTGGILQVVQGSYATQVSSSDTTNYTDTGLTASITPSTTSSKILVFVTIPNSASQTYYNGAQFQIVRASTGILTIVDTNRVQASGIYSNQVTTMQILDSPASSSSTTYKVQFKVISGGSGTMYVQHGSNASYITLLEVAT
jgi:hypothetical protein